MAQKPIVVTTDEARQASPRKDNFRVLLKSLMLALIAGAVVLAIFYSQRTEMERPAQTQEHPQ